MRNNFNVMDLIARYALALLLSVNSLYVFYLVFTPLTFYPAAFLLNVFYEVETKGLFIFMNGYVIEIIKACVAGSAYYLLALLNLTTRGISAKKRALMFLFSAFLLLVFNIARIVFLAALKANDFAYFDATHEFLWYFVSTIFVAGIWLLSIKVFKIKEIPVWSDVKSIKSAEIIRKTKKNKHNISKCIRR